MKKIILICVVVIIFICGGSFISKYRKLPKEVDTNKIKKDISVEEFKNASMRNELKVKKEEYIGKLYLNFFTNFEVERKIINRATPKESYISTITGKGTKDENIAYYYAIMSLYDTKEKATDYLKITFPPLNDVLEYGDKGKASYEKGINYEKYIVVNQDNSRMYAEVRIDKTIFIFYYDNNKYPGSMITIKKIMKELGV